METVFPGTVGFDAMSIRGCEVAFGHKSTLDLQSAAYNAWGFSGASACRSAATTHTTATEIGVALDTLIGDLKKRGILV